MNCNNCPHHINGSRTCCHGSIRPIKASALVITAQTLDTLPRYKGSPSKVLKFNTALISDFKRALQSGKVVRPCFFDRRLPRTAMSRIISELGNMDMVVHRINKSGVRVGYIILDKH